MIQSFPIPRLTYLHPREDGETVIHGTQLTCGSILDRIDAGDSIDGLVAEYGAAIPRAAFVEAISHARSQLEK